MRQPYEVIAGFFRREYFVPPASMPVNAIHGALRGLVRIKPPIGVLIE